MPLGVGSVAILVYDARRAAEWYRDKLGFEIVGNEGHTVFVKPKDSNGPLFHLCGPCDDWGSDKPGGRVGVWLKCGDVTIRRDGDTGRVVPASSPEDVELAYIELRGRGVEFSQPLTTTEWGKYAILRDLDGNEFEIS